MLFLDKFAFHPPAVDLDSLPFQIHLFQPFNISTATFIHPFSSTYPIHGRSGLLLQLSYDWRHSMPWTGHYHMHMCLRQIRIFGEPTYRIIFHIFYVELVVRSTIVPVASTSDKDSLYLRFMCCCFCLFVFLVIHQKLSVTDWTANRVIHEGTAGLVRLSRSGQDWCKQVDTKAQGG